MANIAEISNQLETYLKNNPKVETELLFQLWRCYEFVEDGFHFDDSGYCKIFKIPTTAVINLYTMLSLDKDEVSEGFKSDWMKPGGTYTYHDSYYEILLLLTQYGLRHNLDIAKKAFFLVLVNVWNFERRHYILNCDKWIMKHVVDVMTNEKYLVRRYSSPFILLRDYFVKTLFSTYKDRVINGATGMETLFKQAEDRIGQLFAQGKWIEETETGEKIAQNGLLPLYMDAQEKGKKKREMCIKDTKPLPESSFKSSEEVRADLYENILRELHYENDPVKYPATLISKLNEIMGVKADVIREILAEMHESDHKPILFDIYKNFLEEYGHDFIMKTGYRKLINDVFKNHSSKKTNLKNETETQKSFFFYNIKKGFTKLMEDIFDKINKTKYLNYRDSQRRKIIKVLLYAAIYDYKKYLKPTIVRTKK